MVLNPWDVQSKHIYSTEGSAPPLYAGECRWGGGETYILVKETDGREADLPKNQKGAESD